MSFSDGIFKNIVEENKDSPSIDNIVKDNVDDIKDSDNIVNDNVDDVNDNVDNVNDNVDDVKDSDNIVKDIVDGVKDILEGVKNIVEDIVEDNNDLLSSYNKIKNIVEDDNVSDDILPKDISKFLRDACINIIKKGYKVSKTQMVEKGKGSAKSVKKQNIKSDNKDNDNIFSSDIGKILGGTFKNVLKEATKSQRAQREIETLRSVKKQNIKLLAENKKLKSYIKEIERERLDKVILDLDLA
jgi:prophage DNA circulation protein